MSSKDSMNEHTIATLAAHILRESFIKVSKSETVLYTENDILFSKSPNSSPVLIKHLSGRNPDLAKKVDHRGTYKIKKRKLEVFMMDNL